MMNDGEDDLAGEGVIVWAIIILGIAGGIVWFWLS